MYSRSLIASVPCTECKKQTVGNLVHSCVVLLATHQETFWVFSSGSHIDPDVVEVSSHLPSQESFRTTPQAVFVLMDTYEASPLKITAFIAGDQTDSDECIAFRSSNMIWLAGVRHASFLKFPVAFLVLQPSDMTDQSSLDIWASS